MPFNKCPMCGFSESNLAKPVSNIMNTYKNERDELAVMNSNEKVVETSSGVWKLQASDNSQELSLVSPKSSAAIKAVAEANTNQVSLEQQAGNPITGIAKGAIIVGNPTAKASILPNI